MARKRLSWSLSGPERTIRHYSDGSEETISHIHKESRFEKIWWWWTYLHPSDGWFFFWQILFGYLGPILLIGLVSGLIAWLACLGR